MVYILLQGGVGDVPEARGDGGRRGIKNDGL